MRLKLIYVCGFLLSIHYASIVYLNSSLLSKFVSGSSLNIIYAIGSAGSILMLFLTPFLFRKLGNVYSFLFFIIAEAFIVFGIGSTELGILILGLFLIYQSLESVLYFCLDIALEEETKKEGSTGGRRGLFLTAQNIAWVCAPLALALLVDDRNFKNVYYLSSLALIPVFLIILPFFKNTKFRDGHTSHALLVFHSLLKGGDKTRTIICQFLLNAFYAWMVIYLPLVLSNEMGFSWHTIGIILSIMLLPFLLFELTAGLLADKKFGEKEMLTIGFSVMALSTFVIPFIHSSNWVVWAIVLFITRMGASLVEISNESYFFKHVKAHDTGIISIFRMLRPFAYMIVPLITIPIVSSFSYSASFAFLAILPALGLAFL